MAAMALLGPDRVGASRAFRARIEPIDAVVFAEIRRRRAAADLAERDDILSMLLQARHDDGSPMSDQELRDELMTLLLAGHETTATSLAWAVERLVRHPGAMARLRDGDEEIPRRGGQGDAAAAPGPAGRRAQAQGARDDRRLDLPEGATVTPCIHLIHRRADVYPEPARFRPERFLEQPAGTYTWLPFGGGVRRCLGASFAQFEMKAVLRVIAGARRLRPVNPEPEPVRRRAITLTPGRGTEVIASAG